ncbi:MAG: hypothetical protein ACKVQR_05260 [Aquabacterium sp.]
MLRQMRSTSSGANPRLTELARADNEDNLAWGARAVAAMRAGGSEDWTHVVLLGGTDMMSFRLRVAQSHLRRDMLPSYWSESIVVKLQGPAIGRARALHVPLLQPADGPFATRTNGVVERPLKHFADPQRWPNIAVIALPVQQALVLEKIDAFRKSRGMLDALEHILRWLAFCWGAARTANPLHDGIGLPSACMLETACAAAQFDLTPGLESRASCPEAIWVAARHWQDYFQEFAQGQPVGCYWTPHRYPIDED